MLKSKIGVFNLLVVLVLSLVLVLNGCGKSTNGVGPTQSKDTSKEQKATILKAGHVLATTSPYHIGMEMFAKLIEEKTNGRYKIEIYPNGQIGSERDLIEGVKMGSVAVTIVASGPVSNFAPNLGVVDLPFLFRDYDHADKVFKGEIGKSLMKEVDKAGFNTLAFWENGFRNLTNSKRPINSLADVKGLKIRTMENKMHQALWKELGVAPVPMAWGDAYTAMQQGAIDGQENPLPIILSMKVSEVNKNLAYTEHVYAPAVLLMAPKYWQALSDEDKKIFQQAANEAGDYERKINREQAQSAEQELIKQGMKITHPNKEEFIKASAKVKEELGKSFGDYVQKIEAVK